VANTWNSLPNWVISVNTTNMFKARLDKFWHNQDTIHNFRAQLLGTGGTGIIVSFAWEEYYQVIISQSD